MKSIIEKYKYIILVFLILFIICRISMSLGVVLGDSNLKGFNETSLQTIDFILIAMTIYIMYIIMNINFKEKTKKTRKFKLLAITAVIIGIFFEYIISEFYYFSDPIGGCEYSELCEVKKLLFYNNDDIAIFTNNNSITFYKKYEKGYKVDNSYHSPSYLLKNDDLEIKIYEVSNSYFVYVITKNNNTINVLKDNTDYEFSMLQVANSPEYFAVGQYGKIIDSLNDYTIFLDDKEINISDMKKNN